MSERALGRAAVALTVASIVGALFWFWAAERSHGVGGTVGIVALGAAVAVLGGAWAFVMAGRPLPIDWIFELVRTAMLATLVAGAGALVSTRVTALSIASAVILTSSVVPVWWHRHAVGNASKGSLGRSLFACGTWLAGVVTLLAFLGRATRLGLVAALVAHAVLALVLLGAGAGLLRKAGARVARTEIAVGTLASVFALLALVSGVSGFPLGSRAENEAESSCRAAGAVGLFRGVSVAPVTAYRAPGLTLSRIDCRTTARNPDERLVVVVGHDPGGRELRGSELFVRIQGTPLERARAACDLLLSERCDTPLASPSELVGLGATLPKGESLVPNERGGQLLFLAVTRERPPDHRTMVEGRVVLVPHVVDLATGRLLDAR